MTTIFSNNPNQSDATRFQNQWETSILAATLKAATDLPNDEASKLLRVWLIGTFNASVVDLDQPLTHGTLEWVQAGPTQYDCIYTGYLGQPCSIARVYKQPNGSWAAMVIAGVKDDQYEACATAEWAISRLTAAP